MHVQTIIFHYDGRFFRFKKQNQSYVCDICYWRGEITLQENGAWSAEISQKYEPFEHDKSDTQLQTKEEGMSWIASRLIKVEKQA